MTRPTLPRPEHPREEEYGTGGNKGRREAVIDRKSLASRTEMPVRSTGFSRNGRASRRVRRLKAVLRTLQDTL